MEYTELSDIMDLLSASGLSTVLGAGVFLNVITVIGGIIILAATYALSSFKWMYIGRKAGLDKDWMAFVPFARTVYRLRIVDEAWWRMFFLDGYWLYGSLLFLIINAISRWRLTTFAIIFVTIYLAACLAYNIYYRFKFYTAHAIRPHLSLSILVPGLAFIREVVDFLIAFSKLFPFTGEGTSRALMDVVEVPQHKNEQGQAIALTRAAVPSAGAPMPGGAPRPGGAAAPAPAGGSSVTGLSGMYAGQTVPLAPGDEMVIGRDNAFCNLIVDQNADKVSRKHCGIVFDTVQGAYQVTDYSTNGTFIDGGNRLVANMPTTLSRGTIIALGNRENRFKLN